jgi:hypothetical protein
MQGDASHHGQQGGGPKKNNRKKWRDKEKERHKGSLTKKNEKDADLCELQALFHLLTHRLHLQLLLPDDLRLLLHHLGPMLRFFKILTDKMETKLPL